MVALALVLGFVTLGRPNATSTPSVESIAGVTLLTRLHGARIRTQ